MSISPASLEIHVSRRGHEIYSVDLRYTSSAAPDISGELQDRIYPSSELIPFRPLGGTDAEIDPVAAGRQLSADFYADLQVGTGLTAVLAQLARGREFEPFDRSLDVQISRLRKMIEPDPAQDRKSVV